MYQPTEKMPSIVLINLGLDDEPMIVGLSIGPSTGNAEQAVMDVGTNRVAGS